MDLEQQSNDILSDKGYNFKIKCKQIEIISSILQSDTFAVLPTGYGKSVCYILPPLILDERYPGKKHTSLVVSPLTSLIKDQVQALKGHDIEACGIFAGTEDQQAIQNGQASVLLASPEAILSKYWKRVLENVYAEQICMVAYDEAHCISEWGLDFREDYRKVGILQSILDCPVLALSATVTKPILDDVTKLLGLKEARVISSLPDRPNTFLVVQQSTESYEDELLWILEAVKAKKRSCKKILIYVTSVQMCERLYIWFHSELVEDAYDGKMSADNRLVEMYHKGTDADSKTRIMESFIHANGSVRVLVATVALGMGIDIPDISMTVIWGLSPSVLQLWQEAGRCGRDGRQAIAVCYAFKRSIAMPCDSCRKKGNRTCTCPSREHLRQLTKTQECLRIHILKELSICESSDKELYNLQNRVDCSSDCESTCMCQKCLCCITCCSKCACPKAEKCCEEILTQYMTS